MKVAVSILSEKDNYKESIEKINKTDTDYLHLDIMDSSFTESSSFSLNESKEIKELCNKKIDVHIMSTNLRKIISEYININPYNITFHIENNDIEKYIDLIKEKNINFNNPLNFHTSEMIISAVKNNIGIGYVIEDLITKESDLKIVNIDEKLPNVKINIIYNSKYLTVAPKKFINMYIDKTIN